MSDSPKLSRSVDVVTTEHEVLLWRLGIMSMGDSLGLSRAVYFYFCKAFGVYTRQAVREVIREQFHLGEDEFGRFVEFVDFERPECPRAEGAAAAVEDGDQALQPARRVVQYDDPANDHSVYKIMAAYMAHIPASGDFFRRPRAVPGQTAIQFASRPLGMNLLSQYLPDMMRAAGFLREHFTSQSIKAAVVTTLFRLGVDEEIAQQRTRWWARGPGGRPKTTRRVPATGGAGTPAEDGPLSSLARQKLVAVSRLLDPPPFTPLDPSAQETALKGVWEAQLTTLECGPSADHAAVHSPDDKANALLKVPVAVPSALPQPEPDGMTSNDDAGRSGHHLAPYRWYSETQVSSDAVSEPEERSAVPTAKRPWGLEPQTRLPDPRGGGASSAGGGFVAASGVRGDSCFVVVPKTITHSEEGDEDDDDCVMVSSIPDRSSAVKELPGPASNATVSAVLNPITSSSSGRETHHRHGHHHQPQQQQRHQQHHADPDQPPKNQMQCLSHAEAREAASRPLETGTSTLSMAFKYAYEIDHNGEVAASREVRALHTTARDGQPSGSGPVRRRLLPVNVVDSAGREAAERQEELPSFAIRLSDFFASVSPQRRLDIRDVVIRGSRGQGTDRLNVELVLAENEGTDAERRALSGEPSDYMY